MGCSSHAFPMLPNRGNSDASSSIIFLFHIGKAVGGGSALSGVDNWLFLFSEIENYQVPFLVD